MKNYRVRVETYDGCGLTPKCFVLSDQSRADEVGLADVAQGSGAAKSRCSTNPKL